MAKGLGQGCSAHAAVQPCTWCPVSLRLGLACHCAVRGADLRSSLAEVPAFQVSLLRTRTKVSILVMTCLADPQDSLTSIG